MFDRGLRISDGGKLMDVEAFIANSSVKGLNKYISHGFPRPKEVKW
jgi:hypothetical protein